MALEENQVETPLKTIPSPKDDLLIVSQTSSCQPVQQANISPPKKVQTPTDFIRSVARKFSAQPLQNADPGVWGVLTAISTNARKRTQGINILLSEDEHCIGRSVNDTRFRIEANAVSGNHCKIYREKVVAEDGDQPSSPCISVFLKDTSTNGTYLNWEKLKKNSSAAQIQHGDIVSFAAAPQHEVLKSKELGCATPCFSTLLKSHFPMNFCFITELAFAFVYREVLNSTTLTDGAILKRKAEEFGSESKRLKGIGIGAPDGPISLDDVRSLQRSNMELRKQLESHVVTIERMRDENRAAVARHENEMKELKESISQSYLDDIKELRHTLEVKQKELADISIVSAERQQAMEDLNERLTASIQSRTDAAEVINSQKATISELETQLDEERNQRREEQKKAVADQKAALQRAHSEAQEELARQSDMASRREREFKEVINKLQESDKENRLLAETLRNKLEGTRESLVITEKKVRQLEAQVLEEQQASVNGRKKVESLEVEMRRLRKELEHEKVAREEAWAKVSALELEMDAAIRDLTAEKQRFQDARDRIILRETQLRTFYATTEEISALFKKQQEQLKAMRKTLEDEDNYENTSAGIDLIAAKGITNGAMIRDKEKSHRNDNNMKENSAASTPRVDRIQVDSTSDEASATEKHDCDMKSQEEGHHPQDIECTSADHSVKGAFGSDIDGVGTAPIPDEDQNETERVLGTESPMADINFGERNFDLNKSNTLGGDTMQLDDEAQLQDNGEQILRVSGDNGRCSQSNPLGDLKAMEDTEGAGTIRTADLLASEVAGSWGISTAPSDHGENESPGTRVRDTAGSEDDEADVGQRCLSDCQAAGSQIVSTVVVAAINMSQERQALNQMIEIVEPDFFGGDGTGKGGDSKDDDDQASNSDSDTEEGSDREGDDNGVDAKGGSISDTQAGSDQGEEDNEADAMDESDVNSGEEDSLG